MQNSIFSDIFVDVSDLLDTNLPDPTLLEYYRSLRNREIVWNAEVDDSMIEVTMHIIKWNREDKDIPINERKPIRFW